jgi:uncharacterized membrane protein YkoI
MKYRHSMLCLSAGLLSLAAAGASAKPFKMIKTQVSQETCLQAALAKMDGETVKLEFKNERGTPVYEIEIAGKDGRSMEFECDANTGKIIEEEQEVESPDDPLFKSKAKVSLDEAVKIALKAHPGKIVETEFEIEANGDASYEFDIATDDGREVKLEVDAATGKIVEDDEEEIYQIGRE